MEVKLKTYAANTVCASHHLILTKKENESKFLILTNNEHAEICATGFFKTYCKRLGGITTEKRPVAELIEAIRESRINSVFKLSTGFPAAQTTC